MANSCNLPSDKGATEMVKAPSSKDGNSVQDVQSEVEEVAVFSRVQMTPLKSIDQTCKRPSDKGATAVALEVSIMSAF